MSNRTTPDDVSLVIFAQQEPSELGLYTTAKVDGYPVLKDYDGNIVFSGAGGAAGVVTLEVPFTGGPSSNDGIGALLNPFGQTVVIQSATLVITTVSTGASTLDIGVAADAVTSSDTLIDGYSGATLARVSNLIAATAGTNGGIERSWGATEYVTVSEATGDVDGIVGYVILTVRLATS